MAEKNRIPAGKDELQLGQNTGEKNTVELMPTLERLVLFGCSRRVLVFNVCLLKGKKGKAPGLPSPKRMHGKMATWAV